MLIKGVAPGDAFLSLHPVHQLKNTSAVGDHGCRAKLGAADILRYAVQEMCIRDSIPLDEYPRRCVNQIEEWKKTKASLTENPHLEHTRTHEYGSYIMEAMVENKPYKIGDNVINTGLITNLPSNACVEVPCIADASGVQSVFIGDLPEQCAAMNRTNINPQLLAIEAAVTKKKDYIYQAAMLDPHTAAELTIDQIVSMCDDLIEAHKGWLPEYH